MSGAAIFDLDRTLLQGGTGPLLSRAMYDLGVVTRRLPGERLLYGLFDLVGETLPSIGCAATSLFPALAMVALTLIVWLRMYAERIGQMKRERIHPQAVATSAQMASAAWTVITPFWGWPCQIWAAAIAVRQSAAKALLPNSL